MKHWTWLTLALSALGWTAPVLLTAQAPGAGGGVRAERLRQELEARFAQQVKTELGLSDEQAVKVRDIMEDFARRRRHLEAEERRLRQALHAQLRPGIAANPDSVSRLVDRTTEVRVAYVQLLQEEMKQLTPILTPVQRGQLLLLRDRILQRIQELREQRRVQGRGTVP